jgi:hypothetical protein
MSLVTLCCSRLRPKPSHCCRCGYCVPGPHTNCRMMPLAATCPVGYTASF